MQIYLNYMMILASFILVMFLIQLCFREIKKRHNALHLAFSEHVLKAIVIILYLYFAGRGFEATKEFSRMVLAGSGLLVAIAGFAAQQTLADVIAGFMLSVSHPFNIGERITLMSTNTTGIVENITLRHTVICLYDNNRIIIPNSIMNREVIRNSNFEDSKIGNYIEVEVSYESDLDEAILVIKKILQENPMTVEKDKISVLIKDFSANGIILKTTVWTKTVDENFKVCSDVRREILRQFQQDGIVIPYTNVVVRGER
ncbi:MAG: mechanosensitive ion channel family protein [Lachnospiraceae bacterium]|nr:mechanosensitive ion channel family protein [Lachnospiraceae bacterium]